MILKKQSLEFLDHRRSPSFSPPAFIDIGEPPTLMRAINCSKCRPPYLSSASPLLLTPYKHQRLISSATTPSSHDGHTPPPQPSGLASYTTAGEKGSADYIPHKQGYAPNIPIPSRKFNLPSIKPPKPIPDPNKVVCEPHPKTIRTIGIHYERQMSAMRRDYMKWRARQVRDHILRKREAMAQPPKPGPKPFRQSFAEQMADPSFAEQRTLEKQLWGAKNQRESKRLARVEKLKKTARFNAAQNRKRERIIENYLELYHTCANFITTEEALNEALNTQFPDKMTYLSPGVEPQTYREIAEDFASGARNTSYDIGYAARIRSERRADVIKVLTGNVAGGKPGVDEVLATIQRAMKEQGMSDAHEEVKEKQKRVAKQHVTDTLMRPEGVIRLFSVLMVD